MSDVVQPPKAKIWRETLEAFRRHAGDWLPSAIIFFVLYACIGFFAFEHLKGLWNGMQQMPPDKLKDHKEAVKELLPLIMHSVGWVLLLELIVIVQYYYHTVFFSRRELPGSQPVLGVGRFFYTFAKLLQVVLIYVGIGVLSGVLMAVIKIGLGGAAAPADAKIAIIAVRLVTQVFVFYLGIRYYFVVVLAANKMRPVLKTSWKLTHGNWWRVLWNKIVVDFWLMLFLFAAFLIAGIVGLTASIVLNMPSSTQASPACIAIMASAGFVLSIGVFAAFTCIGCRILLDEKRRADPSFSLTTSS